MSTCGTLRWRKMFTAPTAPLAFASVKMSSICDACVTLASHETSAIQGVVAAWRLLARTRLTWAPTPDKDHSLVSLAVYFASASEKRTSAPCPHS